MVSTQFTSPCNGLGLSTPERRDRVDPAKLIGLIHRIKAASGSAQLSQPVAKLTQTAKAG
ncbi:MAG: hypothetical protein ABJF50_22795 [Paracoccaceae bacterium]